MSKGGDRPGGSLQAGSTISRYRVISPLGVGGMGEVYMARDESLERTVALKVLPADLVRNEERVRRFVTEAKSASSLSHPHIVTIHEIGHAEVRTESSPAGGAETSAPIHYIAMELVTGDTLRQLIHEKATDLRTLLRWLAQAADGIAKAHAAGIVHRDLKPDNIMVTKDGYAKVLDFGLAKLTERQEAGPDLTSAPTVGGQATREGTIIGTAGYMSPEQVQGKGVDHRSDIFSFGCILYEAATRRRAFAADSDIETMHKILKDKPVPIEELNPEAPAELRRLIRRCLAKSPEQRLQSMKDLAIELNELAEEYDELSIPSGSRASATRGSGASGSDGFVPGGAPSSSANAGSAGQGWPASGASRESESLPGRGPRDAASGAGSRPGSSGAGAAYPSSPSAGPGADGNRRRGPRRPRGRGAWRRAPRDRRRRGARPRRRRGGRRLEAAPSGRLGGCRAHPLVPGDEDDAPRERARTAQRRPLARREVPRLHRGAGRQVQPLGQAGRDRQRHPDPAPEGRGDIPGHVLPRRELSLLPRGGRRATPPTGPSTRFRRWGGRRASSSSTSIPP